MADHPQSQLEQHDYDSRTVSILNGDAIFLSCFSAERIASTSIFDERRRRQKDLTVAREQHQQANSLSLGIISINSVAAIGLLLIVLFDGLVHLTGSTHIYSRFAEIFDSEFYLASTTTPYVQFFGILNIITTTIFFAFTIYTNATSLQMIQHSKGVKEHKKLAKICYLSGLASTASFIACGLTTTSSSQHRVHLFSIAILQIYVLFMSLGTAKLKQLVSHRVWSYCLSAIQLKIALKVHIRLLFELLSHKASQPSAFTEFCADDLSSIISIAYLIYQENQLNSLLRVTSPTFQVIQFYSSDNFYQKYYSILIMIRIFLIVFLIVLYYIKISQACFVSQSTDTEIPFGIRLHVAKKVIQFIFLSHFGITSILRIFFDAETQVHFKTIENILLLIYGISVIAPMMNKIKGEKKLRKQRVKREAQEKLNLSNSNQS